MLYKLVLVSALIACASGAPAKDKKVLDARLNQLEAKVNNTLKFAKVKADEHKVAAKAKAHANKHKVAAKDLDLSGAEGADFEAEFGMYEESDEFGSANEYYTITANGDPYITQDYCNDVGDDAKYGSISYRSNSGLDDDVHEGVEYGTSFGKMLKGKEGRNDDFRYLGTPDSMHWPITTSRGYIDMKSARTVICLSPSICKPSIDAELLSRTNFDEDDSFQDKFDAVKDQHSRENLLNRCCYAKSDNHPDMFFTRMLFGFVPDVDQISRQGDCFDTKMVSPVLIENWKFEAANAEMKFAVEIESSTERHNSGSTDSTTSDSSRLDVAVEISASATVSGSMGVVDGEASVSTTGSVAYSTQHAAEARREFASSYTGSQRTTVDKECTPKCKADMAGTRLYRIEWQGQGSSGGGSLDMLSCTFMCVPDELHGDPACPATRCLDEACQKCNSYDWCEGEVKMPCYDESTVNLFFEEKGIQLIQCTREGRKYNVIQCDGSESETSQAEGDD